MTTKNELEALFMFYFLPEDVKTLAFIDDILFSRKTPFDNGVLWIKEDGRVVLKTGMCKLHNSHC